MSRRGPMLLALSALAAFTAANGADNSVAGSAQGHPPALESAQAASAAADRRLDQPAPVNGRITQSVMLAAASVGKRLVVGGERGTIVFSDDCGTRWTQARVPVGVTLTALGFIDDQHGWAVGHGGVVLASRDAGATWSKQLDGRAIARLALASARDAEVAGRPDAKRALADAERMMADGPDKPLFAAHFWSARSGIVVGAFGLALATDDGGASWKWIADRIPNPKGLHLYGVWAHDAQIVLVGEQGLVVRSDDRGQRFQSVATPYVGSYFGVAGTARGATTDLFVYGLRGRAYRVSAAAQNFDPLKLPSQASVFGVLAQGSSSLLFDADGQILEVSGSETVAKPVASSPVGPVLGAAPACGTAIVLAGMRGLAVVEPAAMAMTAAKGAVK